MFNHTYNSRVSTVIHVMSEVNLIQQGLINKTIDSSVIVIKIFFYKTSTTVVVLEAHGYKKKLGVMTVIRMVTVLGTLTY